MLTELGSQGINAEVLVVGGGVIGLALAWELVQRGSAVCVVDGVRPGKSASWAAAGILPPGDPERAQDPLDRLQGYSHRIYPEWVAGLEEVAAIDVEYRQCGGIHIARDAGEAISLDVIVRQWREEGIRVERLPLDELPSFEPAIGAGTGPRPIVAAYHSPDECQVRPPKLLEALRWALAARRVPVVSVSPDYQLRMLGPSDWELVAREGTFRAAKVCLTSGAWNRLLVEDLAIRLELEPRRGQMVLFAASDAAPRRIINEGPRYLVPRKEGRVLVGSTVEEVGFDASTRPEDLAGLAEFAREIVPGLRGVAVEASWAGLRPKTGDGYPFLGPIPLQPGLFIATGHFRGGILMAPATAQLMADLIMGRKPFRDPTPFRIDRE